MLPSRPTPSFFRRHYGLVQLRLVTLTFFFLALHRPRDVKGVKGIDLCGGTFHLSFGAIHNLWKGRPPLQLEPFGKQPPPLWVIGPAVVAGPVRKTLLVFVFSLRAASETLQHWP